MKLYQRIATIVCAISNCKKSGNAEWLEKWSDELDRIEIEILPYGSGFNAGCKVMIGSCSDNKLVIKADFHHMNQNGYYSGWGEYSVIVKPSLRFGFTLKVTGRDRDGIKEYIANVFHELLDKEVKP